VHGLAAHVHLPGGLGRSVRICSSPQQLPYLSVAHWSHGDGLRSRRPRHPDPSATPSWMGDVIVAAGESKLSLSTPRCRALSHSRADRRGAARWCPPGRALGTGRCSRRESCAIARGTLARIFTHEAMAGRLVPSHRRALNLDEFVEGPWPPGRAHRAVGGDRRDGYNVHDANRSGTRSLAPRPCT